MANHKNSEKCIRKTQRRTAVNTRRRTIVRSAVKKIEISLGVRETHGQTEKTTPTQKIEVMRAAESALMRAAQQGVISKKAASRKVSRLTQKMKKLSS